MTEAQYSAMQAGAQIAQIPQIAPIADIVMQNAGYQEPNPQGIDPNFPMPQAAQQLPIEQPQPNTSPQMPPVPRSPMQGIETQRTTDNLGMMQ